MTEGCDPPSPPTFRWLVHWSLRARNLCGGPADCAPDPCDVPEDERGEPVHSESCPLMALHQAIAASAAGHLLQRVLQLDSALRIGLAVDFWSLPADEFRGLEILAAERERHEREHGPDASVPDRV